MFKGSFAPFIQIKSFDPVLLTVAKHSISKRVVPNRILEDPEIRTQLAVEEMLAVVLR